MHVQDSCTCMRAEILVMHALCVRNILKCFRYHSINMYSLLRSIAEVLAALLVDALSCVCIPSWSWLVH